MLAFAAVAQLDRVLGYEPRGRGFNSCQPHQNQVKRPGEKSPGLFSFPKSIPPAPPSCPSTTPGSGYNHVPGATGIQKAIKNLPFDISETAAIILSSAAVAQLDRVLGYEPRGRGFNSCQPHQESGRKVWREISRPFFFARPFSSTVFRRIDNSSV